MGTKKKCTICGEVMGFQFKAMPEWEIEGLMCGKCYSKKLNEHYPGEHVRVNRHLD